MSEPLTSLKNPRIRQVVKLRDRRTRNDAKRFLIEGYRELSRAVVRSLPLEEVFVCPELFLGANERPLLARAERDCGAAITEVARHVFERIAYRDRPEGLLAVAPLPEWGLDRLPATADPLYVVAVGLEKPGNLGTILRSADAAGATGVIACDEVTDLFNPNVVRASVGTLFTVPAAEAGSDAVLAWLRARGVRIVAATPAAETMLWDADLRGPLALAIGSEQYGLPERWLAETECRVRIPMAGEADSLNAAAAAAILLFEAVRQRRRTGSSG